MSKILHPIADIDGHKIEFCGLREVGQGGPDAGYIEIDGVRISDRKFGFPPIAFKGKLYSTLLSQFRLKNGFTLCEIDMLTKSIVESNVTGSLIQLEKIDDGKIYFLIGNADLLQKNCINLIEFKHFA